jgi:hypothetical protein
MSDLIVTIITSASVSAVLAGALVWLSKTWIGERLKNAIKHEYDQKLELHKARLKGEYDSSLARLNADLSDLTAERDARRDYEYEARKRLYEQYEPLLFQLVELSENALHRVYSLARTASEGKIPIKGGGWLNRSGYYMRSTLYKLLAPIAIFKQMQSRLTFVDMSLDLGISAQYTLSKILYLSFTCDFELAKFQPTISYDPNIGDWEKKREEEPQKYWRQGVALGRLDNMLDDLLIDKDSQTNLRTFGEYENLLRSQRDGPLTDSLRFIDVFLNFHPLTRPVLWRILITQAHVHRLIIGRYASTAPNPLEILTDNLTIPTNDRNAFDWRSNGEEAPTKEVLEEPFDVAEKFVGEYLKDFMKQAEHSSAA